MTAQPIPEPQYRDSNPKVDLYTASGQYVGSTNWHRTCRDALAWFAANRPEKGVAKACRDNRRR